MRHGTPTILEQNQMAKDTGQTPLKDEPKARIRSAKDWTKRDERLGPKKKGES